MGWILEGIIYWLVDVVQGFMGMLVGVYESIKIDIGYDASDTSPGTLFSYTYFTDDSKLKGSFDEIFSQAHIFMGVFLYLAYAIVLFLFVFKLYHAMVTPDGRDAENPWRLTGRFFLSLFLITWSYSIFIYAEKIAQTIFSLFQETYLTASGTAKESFLSNLFSMTVGASMFKENALGFLDNSLAGIKNLLVLILLIGFMVTMIWQYCRLLLEVVERYVLLGVMFYTCPLAFSAVCSESTKGFFRNWLQVLFSQFLLMMLNLFFIGVFVAGLDTVYSLDGREYAFTSVGDFVFKNFLLLAWLIVAQKMDQHLRDLGFSVSQAGTGLAGAMVTTVLAASRAARPVLRAAGDLGKAAFSAAKGTPIAETATGAAAAKNAAQASAVTAAGSAVNTAKVENLSGRDPNTGALTKEGVKEAMDGGATLTGQDAKQAASVMGMPQAGPKNAEGIDWSASQINRDGATFMSKADPGAIDSHVGFGNDWVAKDGEGNEIAQVAVPTSDGFADGTRAMTDEDLICANRQVLDGLTNPNGQTAGIDWKTPGGSSITDTQGNYADDALQSPYYVGTDQAGNRYVAGSDNLNTFDIDRGGNITSRKTNAHGDVPSYSYSVQKIDAGCEAGVKDTKSVLHTGQTAASSQSDFVLQRKKPAEAPVEPKSVQAQTFENFKALRLRRKKH